MVSEIILTVDASRIRALVELFAEMIEEHRDLAQRLGCRDEDKIEAWAERFKNAISASFRVILPKHSSSN